MKQILIILAAMIALAWAQAGKGARAESNFEPGQRAALAQNPPGLTCTLSLPDGKTQFRQGEIVDVTLAFTSDRPGQYQLNQWMTAPMPFDEFRVSPSEAAPDPLAEERGKGGGFSGYIPPPVPITATPTALTLTLNEQVRFDRPGTYQIYAVSRRVLTGGADPTRSMFSPGTPVASNSVSLTIAPADPDWARAQVQTAMAEIAAPHPGFMAPLAPLRTLRFLGTREAAQALLAVMAADDRPRSSPANSWECRLGLIGFADRPWLVAEMQRDLAAPDYAVTGTFLDTLAQLSPANTTKREVVLRQLWRQAADAVPAKTEKALPMTLHTLLETAWLDSRVGQDAAVQARLPDLKRRLAPLFDRLPPLPQEYLLGSEWAQTRSPALLPPLRRLWVAAVRPENGDFGRNDLVLRRLYDLSPREGRALILQEAARPNPRATIAALGLLPDKTLPALDQALAANLTFQSPADLDIVAALIARYATPAIFPRVRAFYGDPARGWACAFQSALLSYFLRVRPTEGGSVVEQALANRKTTGCYKYLFTEVAALRIDPVLEKIALARLNDADPEVVANAAQMLGRYGSPRVEASLWARLQQRDDDAGQRAQWEWQMVQALATAPNWYESPARLRQIREVCVTPSGRQQAAQLVSESKAAEVRADYFLWNAQWNIGAYSGFGQAAFEAKMAQFPRGTLFSWQDTGFGSDAERLFSQTQTFAWKHGMALKRLLPAFGK